ncbi:hypothetical protein [Spiroplasma endosymbiont of Cantharis lateralis]|uniref:hypothetical protein n=1 Tax=Spiroplasma endosymbiont of Cantharis lateralis TaxID=3066277 RepID=UPI00313A8AB8
MNKLLATLSSISLSITAVPTLVLETNKHILEKNENNLLNSEYATLNLSELKLKSGEVNLYPIINNLDDEKFVVITILSQLSKINDKESEILEIITSVQKNYDDWFVVMPQLPTTEGSKSKGDLTMLYLGDSKQFEGILNIKDIFLINENTVVKPILSEAIKITHMGEVKKLNKQVLEAIVLTKNEGYGLKKDDFFIETITYKNAVARATKYGKYIGSVIITFEDVFSGIANVATQSARSDAYNSEQSDFKTSAVVIDIDLGKSKFLSSYKYMDYSLNTNYYTQGMGRFNYTVNQKEPNPKNQQYKDTNHIKPKYKRINVNENTTINAFDLTYKNVNQEKAFGTLTTKWLNDFKFKIRLSVNTWVWASAWNAYWARAEASMSISDIKFS